MPMLEFRSNTPVHARVHTILELARPGELEPAMALA
jgi:hypothetical protein